MAPRHLLDMEHKGYSSALGGFLMGGNGIFSGSTSLMHFAVIDECLGWRTTDFEEMYGGLGQ